MFWIEGKNLSSYAAVKDTLNKYGLFAKKKYGQNFLVDGNILQKIVDAANVTSSDLVVEIGPGLGVLTTALAENAGKVIAVEIDRGMIPVLKDNLSGYDNIEILNEDFLKLNLGNLIESYGFKKATVAANLPYYITTPVIFELLENRARIESAVVMVQKEVGERMAAKPSTKQYGALTLSVNYYADVSLIASVSPNCFYPRPDVESVVVKLDLLEKPKIYVSDEDKLFRVIRAAFAMRRKTLANCLFSAKEFNLTKDEAISIIKKTGLNENVRGEALTMEQFVKLTENLGLTQKVAEPLFEVLR